jgi:hypothetical protein
MLQMLVYDQDERCSPVASLWTVDKRHNLAGRLARTLRQAQGALLPQLADEQCNMTTRSCCAAGVAPCFSENGRLGSRIVKLLTPVHRLPVPACVVMEVFPRAESSLYAGRQSTVRGTWALRGHLPCHAGVSAPRLPRLLTYLVMTHQLLMDTGGPSAGRLAIGAEEHEARALVHELGCYDRDPAPLPADASCVPQARRPCCMRTASAAWLGASPCLLPGVLLRLRHRNACSSHSLSLTAVLKAVGLALLNDAEAVPAQPAGSLPGGGHPEPQGGRAADAAGGRGSAAPHAR